MSEAKPSEPQPTTPTPPQVQPESKAFAAFKAFWSSFPGILTAIGGVIAALAALIGSLDKAALLRRQTPPPPTAIVSQAVSPSPTLNPSPLPNPTATGAPSPTPVIVVTPSPAATSSPATPTAVQLAEGALLVDDFSSAGSGWQVEADQDFEIGYKDGEYRVMVHNPGLFVWGNPKRSYDLADFLLEVDARRAGGPVNNQIGLVVRRQNDQNFYLFSISSDGTYGVDMLQNDTWSHLVAWTSSKSIKQDTAWNHLRVECVGARMRFYVNNDLLAEVEDNTFASGNIGLGAGTMDEGGVEVRFDNLRLQVLKRF